MMHTWVLVNYSKPYVISQFKNNERTSVVRTLTSNAGSVGSIPCQGVKIPLPHGQKIKNIKQKQYYTKLNKGFKINK